MSRKCESAKLGMGVLMPPREQPPLYLGKLATKKSRGKERDTCAGNLSGGVLKKKVW